MRNPYVQPNAPNPLVGSSWVQPTNYNRVVDGTTEQQPNGCMIRHDHHRHTWIVHEPMVTCEKCVKIHDQQILRETFPRLNQTGEGFLLIFVDRIITNFMGCDEADPNLGSAGS